MSAWVKLRFGNMFDGPADLVVFPTSTAGTVTDFVAKTLRNYKIPPPKRGMGLGEVDIQPFVGGENIAQYVAFAASVVGYSSTPEAIQKIGKQLGSFASQEESVRDLAAPLLGAGAGGLPSETVVESLRDGFLSSAPNGATLTISILDRTVLEQVAGALSRISTVKPGEIRAFLSYTATNQQHAKWVESLATFLRQNGINARLDMWHLRKGMDLPQWMTNELKLADRVVIISNEAYAQRADGRHGGVGWETMIIQGDVYSLPPYSMKYLVIVREASWEAGLPTYLKTKLAIHWPPNANDNALRQELLKELFNVISEPPIGEPPVYIGWS